jgi:PAS domain S-box-containing protein
MVNPELHKSSHGSPVTPLVIGFVLIAVVFLLLGALQLLHTRSEVALQLETVAMARRELFLMVVFMVFFLVMSALLIRLTYRNWQMTLAAEKNMKRHYERLELMLEVSQYHAATVQNLLEFALEKVIKLTESSSGYMYHFQEGGQRQVVSFRSKDVLDAGCVAGSQSMNQFESAGIWGETVRQRQPILLNDFEAAHPLMTGFPENHIYPSRFMSIPIFDNEEIVAVVGVANKVAPYDQSDTLQLTLMMEGVWKIGERIKLEEQISRAGHEWQITFDSISDSIALIDINQRIIRCNSATCQILGLEFSDIIGQFCCKLFHGTDTPIPDCAMAKVKHSLHSECATIYRNGRWLDVTVDPILSKAGEMTSAVHIVRDVTERVSLVNAINDANELSDLFMKHSPIYCFIKEVTNTESRVLQVSDNFIDLVGIPAKDMIGKTMSQLFQTDFADSITSADLQVVATQEVLRIEEELQGHSYITYKFPIQRCDGRKLLAGYSVDISMLKHAQNELKKQTSVLNGVMESPDLAVFSVNGQYCYTSFNYAHARIMKDLYDADIKIGDSILSFMTCEDAEVAQSNFNRALNGESFELEADIGDANRLRTFFEISHNPIRDEMGGVVGVAIFARDISERKQNEESLREIHAQMMQQDKLATIGQLAAGVAHEINNPMGFVGSNLVTLGRYIEKYHRYIDSLEQEIRACSSDELPVHIQALRKFLKLDYIMSDMNALVEECNDGIERVKRIVQDLRTFSRADSSVMSKADLNSCLDSTINIVINEIKYTAELKREYSELPIVLCNVQQISQVFVNLLTNAVHAIQTKDAENGEIVVRTWCNTDNVFVSIADTGCGIPPENIGRIFDAFYTTKEVGKGTGLGLSISAGIIHKHGGEICVDSEVGTGTTFTVSLPLMSAQLDDKSAVC